MTKYLVFAKSEADFQGVYMHKHLIFDHGNEWVEFQKDIIFQRQPKPALGLQTPMGSGQYRALWARIFVLNFAHGPMPNRFFI